jgi:glyoxylase-like metal-dependent hydrolase (beta-lactamase superfamily II)
LCNGDQDLMLASPAQKFVPQKDFERLPYEGFAASDYAVKACPNARRIGHGDVIDLGNKAFEVMHLPGHSSGSIGLHERRTGQFFSGDVVYDGELLDRLPDSVIEDYLRSMERLLDLKIVETRPGHYQSFGQGRLRTLVRKYIDSRQAPLCPREA